MAEEEVIKLDDSLEIGEQNAENATSQEEASAEGEGQSAKKNPLNAILTPLKAKIQPLVHDIKDNTPVLISLVVVVILFVLLVALLLVWIFMGDSKKEEEDNETPPVVSHKIVEPSPILSGQKRPEIDDTELGNMIKKANILYLQGDKIEALNLFENIAIYSQSIANYNLGVIKIKENDYQKALSSFDSAIATGEDISVSAFNAAYSAYMLNNMDLYEYYLGISSNYLYNTANQPLYSYLYGLLHFYRGFYFESLSPFLNPSSQSYAKENKRLASEVFLVFGDEYNALAQLKQVADKDDNFAIALLHARLGEYTQAKQYLYEYMSSYPNDQQSLMALQLIELKNGNYNESASILDKLNTEEENEVFKMYPIKAKLSDGLFDINLAQESFWNRKFEHDKMLGYKILFYYAPFLVFDAKKALEIIEDGNLNAYSSNIESAKSILQDGQKVSQINRQIAQDLRNLALNQDIREIIASMQNSLKTYPNHSVLHYNVGLLYAQMNDFDNAYLHFIRSYHLDSNNTIAAIFALISAELTYRDTTRLSNSISNDLAEINFADKIEGQFLLSLFRYTSDTPQQGSLDWFDDMQKQSIYERKPIYYALNAVYGINAGNEAQVISAFENLKKIYAKDVVANTMYELAKRFRVNLKDVSLQMNSIYKEKNLDMRSIYYGPSFARELYIYVGFVTGSLRHIQEELEAKLIVERRTSNGILQALALSNIYSNDFEKAFAIYNSLLDDLKEDDSQTRFYAAIAAMGANRHENAVALLQLAKMESATNFEARYALGLLYQEGKNMKAAIQNYKKLTSSKFESEFFDFEIDTSDLLDTDKDG